MSRSTSLIVAFLIAAAGIYLGVSLAIYAEKDDSPGGVLLGIFLALGSVALGVWIVRRARNASPK